MSFFNRNKAPGDNSDDSSYRSPFAAAAVTDTGEKTAIDYIADMVGERVVGARLLTNDADKDEEAVRDAAKKIIGEYNISAASQGLPILTLDPDEAARKIVDRILGWGPLTELMEDDLIEDITVNGLDNIWAFRAGQSGWQRTDIRIPSWDYLRNLINRKADHRGTGRAITSTNPSVNAQLPDGSRLHAVMSPVVGRVEGPCITIRRFRPVAASVDDLARLGSFPANIAGFLKAAMRSGLNIAVIGGTGSGKTTFINAMLAEVRDDERVVTCEDTAELQVPAPNWTALLTRDAMEGGVSAYDMTDLVKETLRMRPDRIIIGEVRDGAMGAVMQAANTGHDGVMFTVHANSPLEGIERMETMAFMNPTFAKIPDHQIRKMIASSLHLIVHLGAIHAEDGRRRRLMNIAEIRGMQGDQVTVEPLFEYDYEADCARWTRIHAHARTRDRLQRRAGYDFMKEIVNVA